MRNFALQQREIPAHRGNSRKKTLFRRHFSTKSAGAITSFM